MFFARNSTKQFWFRKIVDTSDDWITTRTGIKERRILDKGIGTSYMAIKAANAIIEKTN